MLSSLLIQFKDVFGVLSLNKGTKKFFFKADYLLFWTFALIFYERSCERVCQRRSYERSDFSYTYVQVKREDINRT